MSRRARALSAGSLVAVFTALPASAHISVDQGGTHKSRYGDGELKEGPCGVAGGTRGAHVYTYAPGQKIQVSIVETIPHPSYFRIAFDDDGDDGFVEPASIEPIDPNRACPFNAADKCSGPDYYNSPAVLPQMDDLNPHATAGFGTKYTWEVQLPNVQCDNCTLQIIQVMEDTIHGAYNPVAGDPADVPYVADIYHQCIDLVLAGPSADGGVVGSGDSGTHGSNPADSSGTPASSSKSGDSGGCTVARSAASEHGAALGYGLAALGLVAARRRRAARR